MSEIIIITKTRIKLLFKRKFMLILSLVLPIVFYIIIGKIFVKSEAYNKIPIVVIDEDKTEISKLVKEKIKKNETLSCVEENKDKSFRMLEDSKIEGIYVLKTGFGDSIKKDDLKNLIDVYYLPQSTAAVGLTDMVAGEIMPIVCAFKAGRMGEELFRQYKSTDNDLISEKIISLSNKLESEGGFTLPIIIKSIRGNNDLNKDIRFDRSELGKRAVLGMIILFNTLFILSNYSSIMREKTNNVYKRIKATGVSKLGILAADALGVVIIGGIMGIIQIGLLYPIFKFNSAITVIGILSIYLVYTFCIASLLIFFTRIFKNYVSLQGFIPQFVFFTSLLGGCLLGIELLPSNIKFFSMLLPAYWANEALTRVVLYGVSINAIMLNLIVLVFMGVVFSLFSIIKDKN